MTDRNSPMTVQELIEMLKNCDPNSEIRSHKGISFTREDISYFPALFPTVNNSVIFFN